MQAHVPPSSAAPVGVPPEASPDPVTSLAQRSLARTHAGEEMITQLRADVAAKDEMARAAVETAGALTKAAEEARGRLERAEKEQRTKMHVSGEAAAAAMRCAFAAWQRGHEREAMSRAASCGGGIMLL